MLCRLHLRHLTKNGRVITRTMSSPVQENSKSDSNEWKRKLKWGSAFAVFMGLGSITAYDMAERARIQRAREIKEIKSKMVNTSEDSTEQEKFLESLQHSKIRATFSNEPNSENIEDPETDKVSESPKPEMKFSEGEDRSPEQVDADLKTAQENYDEKVKNCEENLNATVKAASAAVQKAIELEKTLAVEIANYTKLYRKAMDNTKFSEKEKSEHWANCSEGAERRKTAQEAAIEPVREAKELILKLKESINEAQEKFPELGESIIQAETWRGDMERELQEAILARNARVLEGEAMNKYGELIQERREEIEKELFNEDAVPDDIVKIKDSWKQAAEEIEPSKDLHYLNTVLASQHHQISTLRKDLESEREKSALKMKDAVEQARDDLLREAEEKIQEETRIRFQELEKEHKIALDNAHQKYENEVIMQIKRQTLAHVQHTQDVADDREELIRAQMTEQHEKFLAELESKHAEATAEMSLKFENSLKDLQANHESQLEACNSKFDGFNDAVVAKNAVAAKTNQARKIALGARTLFRNVMSGNKSLSSSMQTLRNHGDETVLEILDRLTQQNSSILSRGVISGKNLKLQFQTLILEARDSIYIPDNSNLFERTLALARSRFEYMSGILPYKIPPPTEINLETLENKEVLAYATYCVETGDLEKATRLLAQVKGDASMITSKWVEESCRFLEFKKAATAILAISEAVSLSVED